MNLDSYADPLCKFSTMDKWFGVKIDFDFSSDSQSSLFLTHAPSCRAARPWRMKSWAEVLMSSEQEKVSESAHSSQSFAPDAHSRPTLCYSLSSRYSRILSLHTSSQQPNSQVELEVGAQTAPSGARSALGLHTTTYPCR